MAAALAALSLARPLTAGSSKDPKSL
jgi:hypothetical protein